MGVFGKPASTVTKTAPATIAKPVAKSAPKAATKEKVVPVKVLRVKAPNSEKSEYLTGLFVDEKAAKNGATSISGKDKEGNRFIVYTNDDGSQVLSYIPAGEKQPVRLTKLFESEGQFGPYASGKSQDGNKFYVADFKPKAE